ncbi:MAG: nitrite/sulfite reductase [Acidaminobacteraceae bacterium]
MTIQIPKSILSEQDVYIKKTLGFINSELSDDEFYHYASSMGVYRQREKGTFMIRPRIFSGVVTYKQLIKVLEIAKEFSGGEIHLTTRQSIQFHKLSLEDTTHVISKLKLVDLVSKGAGGNSIRNIACPASSGVDPDEVFDVTPHALSATEFALTLDGIVELPRKYKIAFSNSSEDEAYALYSDLGFIAKSENDKRGFEVYVAGGLGGEPTVAFKFSDFIDEDEIFAYILAMKRLFEDHGDRENRSKARIRFIRYRLGDIAFKDLYEKYILTAAKDIKNSNWKSTVTFESSETEVVSNKRYTISNDNFSDRRIRTQKQNGNYSFLVQPQKGDLKSCDIEKLIDFIEEYELKDVLEFRLSNEQALLVRNLSLEDANKLSTLFSDTNGKTNIERSISCTGAKNCRIGLCDSQELLKSILELSNTYEDRNKSKLPKLFISGCKNSCGWHWIGALGFAGKKIKTANGVKEGFEIYLAGNTGAKSSKLGSYIGILPNEEIILFLRIVFDKFIELGESSFEVFISKQSSFIREQVEKLTSEIIKNEVN